MTRFGVTLKDAAHIIYGRSNKSSMLVCGPEFSICFPYVLNLTHSGICNASRPLQLLQRLVFPIRHPTKQQCHCNNKITSHKASNVFTYLCFLIKVNSTYVCLPLGDTLLAIRAPSGTQLEVPVPESVSSTLISVKYH